MNIEEMASSPLFHNQTIKRSLLSIKDIHIVLTEIVKMGCAEFKDKNTCFIYFKNLNEWASIVYKYVFDSGKIGGVFTLYELLHGDETEGQEFHGMDQDLFLKVLHVLKSSGKAQTFSSGDSLDLGVKFF